jgi:phosphoribosylformylglycinamidine synthase II
MRTDMKNTEQKLSEKLKHYRLSESEYEKIKGLLGREPQALEWPLFSAMWSEHCSYKSSRIHFKKFFSKNFRVVQSEGENAGIIDLGMGERICFKMESHNHPSYIEPFQGAATGVGGILRDIFTMGARPIAIQDYLCFGEIHKMKKWVDGVVHGISHYGNCVGVPNVGGQTTFDPKYNTNVLVNAMAVGYLGPNDTVALSKAQGPGNWVVYVGAQTGKDGIHGASMASESFSENSEAKKPNVQIGDPFYEKLLIEACLEVIQQKLVVAIQDMGAAGLTSSSIEMASKGNVSIDLDLSKVPLRDPTLTPEEILLSESQERMLLVCEPEKFAAIEKVFSRWGLEASVIGKVTGQDEATRKVKFIWKGEVITEIDPHLLTENAPLYDRPYHAWEPTHKVKQSDKTLPMIASFEEGFKKWQNNSEFVDKSWIFRQYDQRVGAKTVKDASETVGLLQLPSSKRGLFVTTGCRPHIMKMDAALGALDAVLYPAMQISIKGGVPLAITDCLNFGNPEKPEIMSQFVASIESLSAAAEAFDAPIISGNVSFYNETLGSNIIPTPAIGMVGLLKETQPLQSLASDKFENTGDTVFLVSLPMVYSAGVLADENYFSGELDPFEIARFSIGLRNLCTAQFGVTSSRMVGSGGVFATLLKMIPNKDDMKPQKMGLKIERPHLKPSFFFQERFYECVVTVKTSEKEKFNQQLEVLKQEFKKIQFYELGFVQNDVIEINDFKLSTQDLWKQGGLLEKLA